MSKQLSCTYCEISIIICLKLCACHSLFQSPFSFSPPQYSVLLYWILGAILSNMRRFCPMSLYCTPLSSASTTVFMGYVVTVLPHGPLWSYSSEFQLSLSSSITRHLTAISFSYFISSCRHCISSQYHKKYGTWYLRDHIYNF